MESLGVLKPSPETDSLITLALPTHPREAMNGGEEEKTEFDCIFLFSVISFRELQQDLNIFPDVFIQLENLPINIFFVDKNKLLLAAICTTWR